MNNKKILMFDYNKKAGEIPNYIEIISKNRSKLISFKKEQYKFFYGTLFIKFVSRVFNIK